MNSNGNTIVWVAIFSFLLGMLAFQFLLLSFSTHTVLYKHGQVDAINGKILYELKHRPDGTTSWERKSEK